MARIIGRLLALVFRYPIPLRDHTGHRYDLSLPSMTLIPAIVGADDGGEGGEGGEDGGGEETAAEGGEEGGEETTDWEAEAKKLKAESRKHERRNKTASKRAEELEAEIAKLKAAGQSEDETALEKAKEEARAEITAEVEKERRSGRLEVATTRAASRGVKIGEDTVKFADPDDALVHLERGIARGEIDADDIFDNEGKVQTDALNTALEEILEAKPHLRATANGRPSGSSDAGKGSGGSNDLESMSVEDHAKAIAERRR